MNDYNDNVDDNDTIIKMMKMILYKIRILYMFVLTDIIHVLLWFQSFVQ